MHQHIGLMDLSAALFIPLCHLLNKDMLSKKTYLSLEIRIFLHKNISKM